jgi:putative transposase
MNKVSELVKSPYWSGSHTKHRIVYHLVWIPKYRRRLLRGSISKRLQELIEEACALNEWQIHELSIQLDHVHLLVQVQADDSAADVAQTLKGGTSRRLKQEFPQLQEFLWGKAFWARGYFGESVGRINEEIIRKYIHDQSAQREQQSSAQGSLRL